MPGRPRDDRARHTILRHAADLASRDGLEGLTIGRLATELGLSKSGLFGYFGSKEELQLAAIRMARTVYLNEVVQPALAVPPGLGRVRELCESWLSYSQRRVFPGGCFFFAVSAEFDARPGRVRDAVAAASLEWTGLVASTIADARQLGELAADTDADQLAFELTAFLEAANAASLLHEGPTIRNDQSDHDAPNAYERARIAIGRRLAAAAATTSSGSPEPNP